MFSFTKGRVKRSFNTPGNRLVPIKPKIGQDKLLMCVIYLVSPPQITQRNLNKYKLDRATGMPFRNRSDHKVKTNQSSLI